MKHIDALKNEMKVGDYFCYAATAGRSASMHFGLITGLKEEDKVQAKACYLYGRSYEVISKTVTLSYTSKMVVVPDSLVPKEIKEKLNHVTNPNADLIHTVYHYFLEDVPKDRNKKVGDIVRIGNTQYIIKEFIKMTREEITVPNTYSGDSWKHDKWQAWEVLVERKNKK